MVFGWFFGEDYVDEMKKKCESVARVREKLYLCRLNDTLTA